MHSYFRLRTLVSAGAALLLVSSSSLFSATTTIYNETFEGYSGAVSSLDATNKATWGDPAVAFADIDPVGGVAGSGIQLQNFDTHSGTNAAIFRSGTSASVNLLGVRSGSKYQLDFWIKVVKGTGDRNFYIILRGEGADINADDYIAYRSDRAATTNIFYYDGIGPGAAAWVNTGASHIEGAWQHHRMVINTAAQTMDLFIDDMATPVVSGVDLARVEIPVPTLLILSHEGNSADDGYFLVDDVSLTVDDSRDLATTFTDGFESYPARTSTEDDADPQGPWITVEVDGTGSGKERAPTKIQVVDSTVVPPHSGSKCLKLEGGQRAGVSFAWGTPPKSDVQITWWARVPASVKGTTANYLRMSLYGAENGSSYAGDNALLGYGSRDGSIGDETSLTYYVGSGWKDTTVDYTPDTWEEYRLVTHTAQGLYTIIKNPSSATPVVVVDRAPFIGSAATWTPVFMAGWSSSNGSGHPPVYIDDIEIKSLVANAEPLGEPYKVQFDSTRFTNVTTLVLTNQPVGTVAVDPRDKSTILFTLDVAGGSIFQAKKTASGKWTIDTKPVATGLDRPSGMTVAADGTIWWTHDYTMAIMRLKAPWSNNTPETVISDFGAVGVDDDPIDVTIAPANFNGSIGKPGMVIVADRGSDGDAFNALYYVDPATTELNQTGYSNFLINPTATELSTQNLNAITALPQTGEVVTLSEDGFITAVNADGTYRYISTTTLWTSTTGTPSASGIAVDPKTGRIWVADDTLNQIWSIAPDAASADRQEVSFPLTDVQRPDRQIDFHDPGMTFAPDGSFMVVTDTSTANGGGRIFVFHNDAPAPVAFKITGITRNAQGVQLSWEAAGTAKYKVQRTSNLGIGSFTDVSDVLTGTQFTDATPPTDGAYYRVVVVP